MVANQKLIHNLTEELIKIISETNGINLYDTLDLLSYSPKIQHTPLIYKQLTEFKKLLRGFHEDEVDIYTLLNHPVSEAFFNFFHLFPRKYREEHIHLTGSLSAEFIYPRLKKLLTGPQKEIYEEKIKEVYGDDAWPITSVKDLNHLIRLQEGEHFMTYLKILYIPKLILIDRKAHEEAAYHMANELYHNYNVGHIRLKFTLNRSTQRKSEQIPGTEDITEEDVIFGLYDGFKKFQSNHPDFNFVLSPSFRKESDFFDRSHFSTKKEHFLSQVNNLLRIIEKYPLLKEHLVEIDTVGDEKELYRKKHFIEMKSGLRRLQGHGLRIRSHHGETWKTLRKGVQSVDNAMNIWHLDTLEHGLSLGINPNYYFHRLYQRVLKLNKKSKSFESTSKEYRELMDMEWDYPDVRDKLIKGIPLEESEITIFTKTKFHTAKEVEHYQHDILNRMINKNVSLVALPTSNIKLTNSFPDIKDHPFSWWEKKGVHLGVGTDNYITLSTNFIQEMLILLFSDPENLKITKLLMVVTGEKKRAHMSHLLWHLRKKIIAHSLGKEEGEEK